VRQVTLDQIIVSVTVDGKEIPRMRQVTLDQIIVSVTVDGKEIPRKYPYIIK